MNCWNARSGEAARASAKLVFCMKSFLHDLLAPFPL